MAKLLRRTARNSVSVLDLGPLPDTGTCLRLLAEAEHGCWFDRRATGGASLLMLSPDAVIRTAAELRHHLTAAGGRLSPGPWGFAGGWAGYLTHDLGMELLGLPSTPRSFPACLGHYPACLVLDHGSGRVFSVGRGEAGDAAARRLAALLDRSRRLVPWPRRLVSPPRVVDLGPGPRLYARQVRQVQEWIRAGEVYVANLTYRLRLGGLEPLAAYALLRAAHSAPYAALLRDGERWVLSLSPELLLARQGERTWTRPIKGTRRATPRSGAALAADPKERAELTMVVDMERNDLGRVARTGSVRVPDLFAVERHPGLDHLLATVEAEVPATAATVLESMLPGGSVTGAPKRRACELLTGLEGDPRGIYTGAIGHCDDGGDMEWAVAIRTFEALADFTLYGTGSGITSDSVPAREYRETLWKAAGPLGALGVTVP